MPASSYLNNQQYVLSYKKVCDSDWHWWGISVIMDNSKFAYININILESLYRWKNTTVNVGFSIMGCLLLIGLLFSWNVIESIQAMEFYAFTMISFFWIFLWIPLYLLNMGHIHSIWTHKRNRKGCICYRHKNILIQEKTA